MGMVPESGDRDARVRAPRRDALRRLRRVQRRTRSAIASTTAGAKVLLTQDGAWRRGSVVPLKKMADEALEQTPTIEKVVVFSASAKTARPSR